jgi:hypothetical protein
MRKSFFIGWLLAFLANVAFGRSGGEKPASPAVSPTKTATFAQPKTLAALLALPTNQLENVDIARIDLLCAEGLPGAKDLDIEKCVETLDGWARYVKSETEANYHRFVEHPENFKNSLGRYRMAVMAAVLCQDLRVQYNPKREKELFEHDFFTQGEPYGEAERSFFSDSSDIFLHGLLSDKRYGTCASLPYLYVAVGRRLGYPVSIAQTHVHGYVYYDEGDGKHFNVEATENRGFVTPSDDDYKHPIWGAPSSPEYFEKRGLLRPLSNTESLAHILAERAAVFRSEGRHDDEAKTWAIAARYFPDTPTWREIEENMQQCAKLDDYQQWRDGVWKELAGYYIPHGPGFAFFQDKKIKLRLFMNENFDRNAIERAADEYKKELAQYSKMVMKPVDSGPLALDIGNQRAPETPPLYFFYRPPDGNEVRVPADLMPPFARGELPVELKQRIINSKPQDPDALLEIMWEHYEKMQTMEHAKQEAEFERIASGNPILICEDSIPPEFRQGVPMELAARLSGLHNAQDIAIEMWHYKQEQEVRRQGILGDPMMSALRQAGIPDSMARMAGLPVSDPQGSGYPSPGIGDMPRLSPLAGIPGLGGLAVQGLISGGNGSALNAMDTWSGQAKQANEQAMEIIAQQIRQPGAVNPGFAPPYQVVPASVAAKNPAVENPMPYGGFLNSPEGPLAPLPQQPMTQPSNRNDTP